MKLTSSILFLIIGFVAWGQECPVPSSTTHYTVQKIAKKKKQLEDPKFMTELKAELVKQIQQTVQVTDKNNTSVINGKENNTYMSNVNITSSGLLINPRIDICLDVVTMSIEKSYMHDLSRNYLTEVIKLDNKSIKTLLDYSDASQVKFIKDQLKVFKSKQSYYKTMIPLALQSKKGLNLDLFSDFESNLKILEIEVNKISGRATPISVQSKKAYVQAKPTKAINKKKKPKSTGYINQNVNYNRFDKGVTLQLRAGQSFLPEIGDTPANKKQSNVVGAVFNIGDIKSEDGVGILGIGFNYHQTSQGKWHSKDNTEVQDVYTKDLQELFIKAGVGVIGGELYMTAGTNINKLSNTISLESEGGDLTIKDGRIGFIGFGFAIPIRPWVSIYGEYNITSFKLLRSGGTGGKNELARFNLGINININ